MVPEIQSCITNVSFPQSLEGVRALIDKYGGPEARGDLDTLLDFQPGDYVEWTAPKWLSVGDVLFFYHAATARTRVVRLLNQAKKLGDQRLTSFLSRAKTQAETYGGTIFALGTVVSQPKYFDDDRTNWHFAGRIFARLENLHVLHQPQLASTFSQEILISRQSAITYVSAPQANRLRVLLAERNTLPERLASAKFTEQGLRFVTKENWLQIACRDSTRFALEGQLRCYFVDHLLNALKDEDSTLLEECSCHRNGVMTGVADYFVKLGGNWIPVEAKLNVGAERDLRSQLCRYVQIDSFSSGKRHAKGLTIRATNQPYCIVVDQSGVYLTSNGQFLDCAITDPLLKRTVMNMASISLLKARLIRRDVSQIAHDEA